MSKGGGDDQEHICFPAVLPEHCIFLLVAGIFLSIAEEQFSRLPAERIHNFLSAEE